MNKRKQTIIFSVFLFAVCIIVLSYILYKYHVNSEPIYYDAPINDKDFEYIYDENNALDILKNMDEDSLDTDK